MFLIATRPRKDLGSFNIRKLRLVDKENFDNDDDNVYGNYYNLILGFGRKYSEPNALIPFCSAPHKTIYYAVEINLFCS